MPWDSGASNLIKALRDGRGLVLDMPDGSTQVVDIEPMPKDADPMAPAQIQALADWIDAGCPEVAGEPSALPPPGEAPAVTPPPPPPPAPQKPADVPPPAHEGGGFPPPSGGG